MHKILLNTHKESNINILKARDYYFDISRKCNNVYRRLCFLLPIILSVLGMVLSNIFDNIGFKEGSIFLDKWLEIAVGVISIASFFINKKLLDVIDNNLKISNSLRETYDCQVLDIYPNYYNYRYSNEDFLKYIEKGKYVKDSDKYEVWYREIFDKNDVSNSICMMMDNVIYTMFIYKDNYKRKLNKVIIISSIFALYCIAYLYFYFSAFRFNLINPFIMFLSIFDYITDAFEDMTISNEMSKNNKNLYEIVIRDSEKIKNSSYEDNKLILRCIQDVVAKNRDNSLFIPKKVRNEYLKNGSEYYKVLDNVKNLYWNKDDLSKPIKEEDFQIFTDFSDKETITLKQIHDELFKILLDIKNVLDSNNKEFLLDGGTLIGACRDQKNFLSWDDDVDISIKSKDASVIFKLLKDKLGEKYDIQDYYNEEFYSPRLSRMRVRQKVNKSIIAEKDSELYEKYKYRGLFVDIYAYSPILYSLTIDKLYRCLLINPVYKKIRKEEFNYKHSNNSQKSIYNFKRLKKKYLKRSEWYKKHANNDKYYVYEPNYINDLKKPGPYINKEDIYGKSNTEYFCGTEFSVPSNCDNVLTKYYGSNWRKSPLQTLNSLEENGKIVYSKELFDASVYKHLWRAKIIRDVDR